MQRRHPVDDPGPKVYSWGFDNGDITRVFSTLGVQPTGPVRYVYTVFAGDVGSTTPALPTEAYDIVIQQIRNLAESSNRALGWSFAVSIGLALWSVMSLTQAIFAALNIAYEEEEKRGFVRFYLSAFTFALAGINALARVNAQSPSNGRVETLLLG